MSRKIFKSVIDSFMESLHAIPDATTIRIIENSQTEIKLTYSALYIAACKVSNSFKKIGIKAGDRLVISLPTSVDFFFVYLGSLFSRIIPLIIPIHKTQRSLEGYVYNLDNIARSIGAKYIILPENMEEQLKNRSSLIILTVPSLCNNDCNESPDFKRIDESSIAHFQATSGSTGDAKFAIIKHKNITTNVRAIGKSIRHSDNDILLTWLPFFHDMGLIGVSYSLYWQCPLIATDASNFVRNPIKFWLELVSKFSATLSPAPNSAFQVCARLAKRRKFNGLNLSSWRVALCGSEPVYEDTIHNFCEAFASYGFRDKTILPVYGLAEATLAVAISDLNSTPFIETIDADKAETEGYYHPASSSTKRKINMVSVGKVIDGHEVRIVNEEGQIVKERIIGEIEFAGPSVVDGYWDGQGSIEPLKSNDGFLCTGDLGYITQGQIYITGRKKEIIIIGGRNFIPSQIEVFVYKIINSPITKGIAAIGIKGKETGTEILQLIIESIIVPRPDKIEIEMKIRDSIEEVYGLTGIVIHWVNKGQIPKTTSGKIQRYLCIELIQNKGIYSIGSGYH